MHRQMARRSLFTRVAGGVGADALSSLVHAYAFALNGPRGPMVRYQGSGLSKAASARFPCLIHAVSPVAR